MKNIAVIAVHPDDETLGAGGTLLKHISEGHKVHWIIITRAYADQGYSQELIERRDREIQKVSEAFGFHSVTRLDFRTAELDKYSKSEIVKALNDVLNKIKPEVIYSPYQKDIHTDHQIISDAVKSATKSFRASYVKRLLEMEVISETDFASEIFIPNVYVDITHFIEKKLEIMSLFEGETGPLPFSRALERIRGQALFRGSVAGVNYAECFRLIKEIS
ncbi:MAG: PIG-L deacetylase family protein [Bacteriovoracaceae bacterium]